LPAGPYWSPRLGKTTLRARQVSRPGGEVLCELRGDRALLSGRGALFMGGAIEAGT
jgi:hypothetical protein